MRINEDTLLEGSKVVLVPYNAEHVPRYQPLSQHHNLIENLQIHFIFSFTHLVPSNRCAFTFLGHVNAGVYEDML